MTSTTTPITIPTVATTTIATKVSGKQVGDSPAVEATGAPVASSAARSTTVTTTTVAPSEPPAQTKGGGNAATPVVAVLVVLLVLAVGCWWFFARRNTGQDNNAGAFGEFGAEVMEMMDNPMHAAAAAARAATLVGGETDASGAAASPIYNVGVPASRNAGAGTSPGTDARYAGYAPPGVAWVPSATSASSSAAPPVLTRTST